ncbi:uncharacterized protein LOC122854380 isoform X2 [Aphidius gifuensis]|uniref:uncharacterized protein LOC122854380 isoform X2 n=1 Tax=Aphidius gifuensis TaxID=684658 RepID=UPI001CDCDBAC|nr:uncharacterized protein LOC122854380 isoform X2 [Aphidius gifuensis]
MPLEMMSSRGSSLFGSDKSDRNDNHQVDESMNTSDIPESPTGWNSSDNFVSWSTFCQNIDNQKLNLIIDVRPKNDFVKNHVKSDRIVFIQEDAIKLGERASVYEAYLQETKLSNSVYNKDTRQYNDVTHQKLFHERYYAGQVFILDWSTTKDNITENRKAELMRIILTKWDFDRCKNVSIVEDDYISSELQRIQLILEMKKSCRVYNTVIQLYEKLIDIRKNEIKWENNYINLTKDYSNNYSLSSTSSDRKLFKYKLAREFNKLNNITKNKEYIENKIENISYNGMMKLNKHEKIIQFLRSSYQSLVKRLDNLQQEHVIWEEKIMQLYSEFDDNDEHEHEEEEGGENNIDESQLQLNNQGQQTTARVETSLQFPLTNTSFNQIRNNLHDELTDSQILPDVDKINISTKKKNNNIKPATRSKIKPKRKTNLKKTLQTEDLILSRYENDEAIQQEPGLRGLANIGGKTCYMNCAIQCLDKIDEFKKHILKMKYEKGSVAGEFIKMLKKLNEIDQPAFTPNSFKDAFKKHVGIQKNFNVDDQQDSQEFLTLLFNELHNDLKRENDGILSEERSIIKDTFEMTVRQKILCQSCFNENDSRKTEYILLAPLPAEDDISLANCLKKYFEEQPLDNTNCAVDGCGSQSRTIILEPLELPPVMIIQLMRFCNDGTKNNCHVDFPTKGLKMNKFLDDDDDQQNSMDQQEEFDLVGVIVHEDTSGQQLLKVGHYFSYIFHSDTNSWYEFNDSIVKKIDESIVTKKDDRKTAYMLFYKKK